MRPRMTQARTQAAVSGNRLGTEEIPQAGAAWASEVRRIWGEGGANTFELARVVCAARGRLRHGDWSRFWRSVEMPFSKKKADRLVAIGHGLGWANGPTLSHLPHGWSILYCLARLERPDLERLIGEGIVHPKLTLREARELIARLSGKFSGEPKGPNVRERVEQFAEFVSATLPNWSLAQRQLASSSLRQILLQIENHPGLFAHRLLTAHEATIRPPPPSSASLHNSL